MLRGDAENVYTALTARIAASRCRSSLRRRTHRCAKWCWVPRACDTSAGPGSAASHVWPPVPGSPQGELTCPEVHRQRWQPGLGSEGSPQRFVGRGGVMWGDLCLSHIPGAARTQSRGCGWPASGREGTGSADGVHTTAPVPKSPEKPGMGWVLASVTHSGPAWPWGLSCTGIPHTPGPATRTQAALALPRLGERGQRGRETHFRGAAGRDWEQRGERLHASLLRPRADHPANAVSAPRLPGESPLAFWAP